MSLIRRYEQIPGRPPASATDDRETELMGHNKTATLVLAFALTLSACASEPNSEGDGDTVRPPDGDAGVSDTHDAHDQPRDTDEAVN